MVFLLLKNQFISYIKLDKKLCISLKTVSWCSVINSWEFVYKDLMKFLNQVYHLIRTLK